MTKRDRWTSLLLAAALCLSAPARGQIAPIVGAGVFASNSGSSGAATELMAKIGLVTGNYSYLALEGHLWNAPDPRGLIVLQVSGQSPRKELLYADGGVGGTWSRTAGAGTLFRPAVAFGVGVTFRVARVFAVRLGTSFVRDTHTSTASGGVSFLYTGQRRSLDSKP